MPERFNKFKKEIKVKDKKIKFLNDEISLLMQADSFRRIDNQGQYSRWNCVLINSIPENNDKDTDKLAV